MLQLIVYPVEINYERISTCSEARGSIKKIHKGSFYIYRKIYTKSGPDSSSLPKLLWMLEISDWVGLSYSLL